jgi:hypothetical protein
MNAGSKLADIAAPVQGMSRGLTLLFAFAGGAAVGNLYWAQPLLENIAKPARLLRRSSEPIFSS